MTLFFTHHKPHFPLGLVNTFKWGTLTAVPVFSAFPFINYFHPAVSPWSSMAVVPFPPSSVASFHPGETTHTQPTGVVLDTYALRSSSSGGSTHVLRCNESHQQFSRCLPHGSCQWSWYCCDLTTSLCSASAFDSKNQDKAWLPCYGRLDPILLQYVWRH